VISRLGCFLFTLLLVGCASEPTEPAIAEVASPFSKPTGSSTNYRVGFVGRAPESNGVVAINLVREVSELNLKENEILLARDHELKSTALLIVKSIKGRVILAKVTKGHLMPDQEVVLPNSKTREEAESLPLVISGS
jgi:hypothetical protein